MLIDMTNGEPNETRCLRCGRKIKTGSYGRACARKIRQAALNEARAEFTTDQQAKRPCYHTLAARILGIASRRSMTKAA